jgi:hypothetical protein
MLTLQLVPLSLSLVVHSEQLSPPGRTVVAWWPCQTTPPANFSAPWEGCHSDAEVAAGVAWFKQRLGAVTTAAPITHRLGENASILELPFAAGSAATPASLFRALRAAGVRVVPTLGNDESNESPGPYGFHGSLLPKLRALFKNPQPLIGQLVDLATEHDLDGWDRRGQHCRFVSHLGRALARVGNGNEKSL